MPFDMSKILIVGKSKNIQAKLDFLYQSDQHHIKRVFTFEDAYRAIEKVRFDLILIDRYLPDGDGLNLVDDIVGFCEGTRMILFSDKFDDRQKISALRKGVDEYFYKPVNLDELAIKTQKLLLYEKTANISHFKLGKIEFYPEQGLLIVDQKRSHIRKKESQILEFFVKRPNQVVTREVLLNQIWGVSEIPTLKTIDVYIKRLRSHLGKHAQLQTIRGFGYRLTKVSADK